MSLLQNSSGPIGKKTRGKTTEIDLWCGSMVKARVSLTSEAALDSQDYLDFLPVPRHTGVGAIMCRLAAS